VADAGHFTHTQQFSNWMMARLTAFFPTSALILFGVMLDHSQALCTVSFLVRPLPTFSPPNRPKPPPPHSSLSLPCLIDATNRGRRKAGYA
jgi:hypothetical protein